MMATFFVPLADSPYIDPCLNLSTTATATTVRPQLPNLSTMASFFSELQKSQEWSRTLIHMAPP